MHSGDEVADQMEYIGRELELFQLAVHWKRYLSSRLRPFIRGKVLEVGAGLGANTPYLFREDLLSWTSLEPDAELYAELCRRKNDRRIPLCNAVNGTIKSLPAEARFDSIIYIDVLEHIEDDAAEFALAYERLEKNGYLLVLCPAHNWLFSPFDRSIGHFRRYSKRMYRELSSHRPLRIEYLDSVGLLASATNKVLLQQNYPKEKQILFWDKIMVRLSIITDSLTCRYVGKSILGVWKK